MRLVILAGAALASNIAIAADWSGSAELGLLAKSGNTESETVNGKFNIVRDSQSWRNSLRLEASNTSADDIRTGEKYLAEAKADYKFTEASYFFGQALYEDDRFSGFDYQASTTLGYGNEIIKTEEVNLFLEVGPGYRVSELESGSTDEEAVVRFAERFNWALSKTAKLEQSLAVLAGDELTTTEFKISVTSNLTEAFALKVGYGLKYSDTVPAENKHADQETSVALVYSF